MNKILFEQCNLINDPTLPAISNLSNILAILYHEVPNLNWVGLYLCDETKKECVLGPFQGKVACTRIPYGSGVVGTCAEQQQTIVVEDVHAFPGHIACDSASQSELVIPLFHDNKCIAVFDIDSPILYRFDKDIKETFEAVSSILSDLISVDNILID